MLGRDRQLVERDFVIVLAPEQRARGELRSDKAAFWAGFWSASFVSIGAAGSIDEDSGFGPWQQGLDIFEKLRSVPPANVAAAAKVINRATLAV